MVPVVLVLTLLPPASLKRRVRRLPADQQPLLPSREPCITRRSRRGRTGVAPLSPHPAHIRHSIPWGSRCSESGRVLPSRS